MHNQLVGAAPGHDVTIECVIEAFPQAITYWQKTGDHGKKEIIMDGSVAAQKPRYYCPPPQACLQGGGRD